jgi:hypothetical protein
MSESHAQPVKYAGFHYIVELIADQALYVLLALARPWLMAHAPDHETKLLAAASPSVAIWLMLLVVYRYYRRIDEFEKQKFLETIAISFGIGSCLLVTYSFLTDAGLAWIAITWAWPTLAVSWALTTAIMHFARR